MLNWGNAHATLDPPLATEVFAPLWHAESARDRLQALLKRGVDLTLSLTLLVALLPLFVLLCLFIRWNSPGNALFRQQRVGYAGRPFTMFKFRTMSSDDDALHRTYVQQWIHNGESAHQRDGTFKITNDPRITWIGRFLRKYSLDELPQLINVLRGEMSLVGPRPALAYEVAEYEPWQRERLAARPGITGLWQVSGRNQVSFERMVKMDVLYIRTRSFSGDLGILFKTVAVVLNGSGR